MNEFIGSEQNTTWATGRARNQGRLVWDEEKLCFPTFHSNVKRIGSSYVTHDLQLSLPAVQISLSKTIPR
jgi:hypothetical protein